MTHPGWRIDDVLARTDLADLLDQLAEPAMFATRGRRWHCPLPDHDDHHASVTIHNNHRGDAIDLVSVTQRLDRVNALGWLAARNGMIPDMPIPPVARREPVVRSAAEVPLDPCVIRYVEACEKILWRPTGRPVLEWLHGRGFDDDLLRANRVGCDPGREMMQRQRGLAYGGSIAAVFPALNENGDVRYVQTRYLDPGCGPKYDNPSAALAKNPRMGWTRTASPAVVGRILVCEGIPDALTAASFGLCSVAVLGSQAPDCSLAEAITRRVQTSGTRVLIVNDNDGPGRSWATAVTQLLARKFVDATRFEPPVPGWDLNEWATSKVPLQSRSNDELAQGF
jgi:hypothetical protein